MHFVKGIKGKKENLNFLRELIDKKLINCSETKFVAFYNSPVVFL